MLTPLYTPEQAAEYLGIKVKTVHQLVREGRLSCIQVTPRDRKFTEAQIQEFIESRTVAMPKSVDKNPQRPLPSLSKKGGEPKKSTRVSEAGLLIREEIRKLCQ